MGKKLVLKYEKGSTRITYITPELHRDLRKKIWEILHFWGQKPTDIWRLCEKKMWCNLGHILNVWIHQCLVNGRNIWLSRKKKLHGNHTREEVGNPIAALAFSINMQLKYEFICSVSIFESHQNYLHKNRNRNKVVGLFGGKRDKREDRKEMR